LPLTRQRRRRWRTKSSTDGCHSEATPKNLVWIGVKCFAAVQDDRRQNVVP